MEFLEAVEPPDDYDDQEIEAQETKGKPVIVLTPMHRVIVNTHDFQLESTLPVGALDDTQGKTKTKLTYHGSLVDACAYALKHTAIHGGGERTARESSLTEAIAVMRKISEGMVTAVKAHDPYGNKTAGRIKQ